MPVLEGKGLAWRIFMTLRLPRLMGNQSASLGYLMVSSCPISINTFFLKFALRSKSIGYLLEGANRNLNCTSKEMAGYHFQKRRRDDWI